MKNKKSLTAAFVGIMTIAAFSLSQVALADPGNGGGNNGGNGGGNNGNGGQVLNFSASINPSSSLGGDMHAYTIAITNDASSTKPIKSGVITVPTGWIVNSSTLVLGGISGFSVSLDANGNEIDISSGNGPDGVASSSSFTVSFSATAPSSAGTGTFTTRVFANNSYQKGGGEEFTLIGSEPTVTVSTPSCTLTSHTVTSTGQTATTITYGITSVFTGVSTGTLTVAGFTPITTLSGIQYVYELARGLTDTSSSYTWSALPDCSRSGSLFQPAMESTSTSTTTSTSSTTLDTLKVHIIKYLDGVHASLASTSYAFPMHSSWNAANLGSGSGDYTLSSAGWGGSAAYEADTSPMNVPANYATNETTNVEGGVLPPDAQCVAGSYRLKGYTWGDSLSTALGQNISTTSPNFSALTADKYVVVWNETCPTSCAEGYELVNGQCQQKQGQGEVTDVCPNFEGVQTLPLPADIELRQDGNCSRIQHSGGGARLSDLGSGEGQVLGEAITASAPAPQGQVLGASTCTPLISNYMRLGKNNDAEEVKKLQQFLNDHMKANLPVTGFFGPSTHAAVKAFQVKNFDDVLSPWSPFGLRNDEKEGTGYVYKTTLRQINRLSCSSLDIPMPQLP